MKMYRCINRLIPGFSPPPVRLSSACPPPVTACPPVAPETHTFLLKKFPFLPSKIFSPHRQAGCFNETKKMENNENETNLPALPKKKPLPTPVPTP